MLRLGFLGAPFYPLFGYLFGKKVQNPGRWSPPNFWKSLIKTELLIFVAAQQKWFSSNPKIREDFQTTKFL
jgi:hypothetical protein